VPAGPVPRGGWCAAGSDYCGYDVEVWHTVADALNLRRGQDWVPVCMGEGGFDAVEHDLTEYVSASNRTYRPAQYCDLSAQTFTVTYERAVTQGMQFSQATYKGYMAIMAHAPVRKRGIWAFMRPLDWPVWVALLGTIFAVPCLVVVTETAFSGRCESARTAQTWLNILIMFEATAHTLHYDDHDALY
jgi:hypothetical protein